MHKIEKYFSQRWDILKETKFFQLEVASFRAKWNIPSEGFRNDNDEIEWRAYFSKIDSDYFLKIYEPRLLNLLQKAHTSSLANYPLDKREADQLSLQQSRPLNQYSADIEAIREHLIDFPRSWSPFLQAYFEYGERASQVLEELQVKKISNKHILNGEIELKIFSYTTTRDLNNFMKSTKKIREQMPLYHKNIRVKRDLNHERDLFILRKYNQGHDLAKIAELVEEQFGNIKMVDNSFYDLEESYIAMIVQDLENSVVKS